MDFVRCGVAVLSSDGLRDTMLEEVGSNRDGGGGMRRLSATMDSCSRSFPPVASLLSSARNVPLDFRIPPELLVLTEI